jgi:DNA-binding beta-propeller fold protein YncE
MAHPHRIATSLIAAFAFGTTAMAQQLPPNPYRVADESFGNLPDGRSYGATSAVYPGPDGRTIWVAERCGENDCAPHPDLTTILQFDLDGNLLRQFGAGMFAWPHGMHVDPQGNVWVTDGTGYRDAPDGLGHVVHKFSPAGDLLMTLGTKGVAGEGPDTFTRPSDVLVAPNGDIFVVDGHGADEGNRVARFSSDGTFIKQWGDLGDADGQFRDPHALAMDSQGRLFVGDRGNSRIQIFDQDGNHIATWKQFGRPSGLFIDADDMLYAADSESNDRRNPGVKRGIYIGSARTGELTAFIPDPADPNNGPTSGTSGAEGVAVDATGAIYGAEVGPRTLRKYVRR